MGEYVLSNVLAKYIYILSYDDVSNMFVKGEVVKLNK